MTAQVEGMRLFAVPTQEEASTMGDEPQEQTAPVEAPVELSIDELHDTTAQAAALTEADSNSRKIPSWQERRNKHLREKAEEDAVKKAEAEGTTDTSPNDEAPDTTPDEAPQSAPEAGPKTDSVDEASLRLGFRDRWNSYTPRKQQVIGAIALVVTTAGLSVGLTVAAEPGNGLPTGLNADKLTTVTDDVLNKDLPAEGAVLVFDGKMPVRGTFSTTVSNQEHLANGHKVVEVPGATIIEVNGQKWAMFTKDGSKLTPNQRLLQQPMGDNIAMVNLSEGAQVAKDNPKDPVAFKLVTDTEGKPHDNTLKDNGEFVNVDNGRVVGVPVITDRDSYLKQNVGPLSLEEQMKNANS